MTTRRRISASERVAIFHNAHGICHLPVLDNDKAVGVISVRDLLRETVEHHTEVISELERERMQMLTSTA